MRGVTIECTTSTCPSRRKRTLSCEWSPRLVQVGCISPLSLWTRTGSEMGERRPESWMIFGGTPKMVVLDIMDSPFVGIDGTSVQDQVTTLEQFHFHL